MITKQQLKQLAPNSIDSIIDPLVKYLNIHMPKYEVTTYLRICHFLAQAAHEAAAFRTLREYASGAAYEGRKDLGNVKAGDGVRYKGRGIFQLTGRSNYKKIGELIGVDLENHPELAETPEVSVLTALEYWKSRNLNPLADRDDVENITRRINGGLNGFDDRKRYLVRAKAIIPKTIDMSTKKAAEQGTQQELNLINPILAKLGDKSSYVKDLQDMLVKKGAKIAADGIFGPLTEQAVKDFQKVNSLEITGKIDTRTVNLLMV